ncbi:hypothetical protein, partial [Streptomyces sp. BE133]|uniref:hypothetical protein n=1 Tax=Streptomyces sp. BE133 TaxID=3002523 RepID=UPI002E76CC39
GELRCRQVTTADVKDPLHINVRDSLGTANVVVYDADGTAVTDATASTYNLPAALITVEHTAQHQKMHTHSYRFDALRIAGAEGPAAECEKVPNVAFGYGPVTGTLDE